MRLADNVGTEPPTDKKVFGVFLLELLYLEKKNQMRPMWIYFLLA